MGLSRGGGLAGAVSIVLHLLVAAALVQGAPRGAGAPAPVEAIIVQLSLSTPSRPGAPARVADSSVRARAVVAPAPGPSASRKMAAAAPAASASPLTPTAPPAPAPAPPTSDAMPERPNQAAEAYARLVWARIAARPPRAVEGAGTAWVTFRLDRSGRLAALRLTGSSGRPAFDRAALATVRAAAPFSAPPAGLAEAALMFEVPIRSGGGPV
ncbi:MAG: TonB family protein [Caulobacter sp.]|nr:TonB family protein [Caulobacter sp.]